MLEKQLRNLVLSAASPRPKHRLRETRLLSKQHCINKSNLDFAAQQLSSPFWNIRLQRKIFNSHKHKLDSKLWLNSKKTNSLHLSKSERSSLSIRIVFPLMCVFGRSPKTKTMIILAPKSNRLEASHYMLILYSSFLLWNRANCKRYINRNKKSILRFVQG